MVRMDGLTSGDVARQASVHVETLRYYERRGLLPKPPRSIGNYRLYPAATLRRVQFVKRAQELGFSLREVKELLALRATPGAKAKDVRDKATTKIADIRSKMRSLRAMEKALTTLVAGCSGKGLAARCTILEALESERRA